jgi:hypothetical protein
LGAALADVALAGLHAMGVCSGAGWSTGSGSVPKLISPSRAVGKLCDSRNSSGGENSSSEAALIVEVKGDGWVRMMFDSQADALIGNQ